MKRFITCRHCGGTGRETDHRALGNELRLRREQAGVSLRMVADRMQISAAYLSDLERGNRRWTNTWRDFFIAALNENTKTKTKKTK